MLVEEGGFDGSLDEWVQEVSSSAADAFPLHSPSIDDAVVRRQRCVWEVVIAPAVMAASRSRGSARALAHLRGAEGGPAWLRGAHRAPPGPASHSQADR